MKRTENTIRNVISGVGGQILLVAAQFMCRSVFIQMLSKEYLGLNGLFSNILSILALSEMGFGTAVIYSLYRPLAEQDREKIRQLLQLYKRIFTVVALFVLVVGGALTPFIHNFIRETPDVEHLQLIYLLYLLNTVFSYVYIYKRSIIEADQKSYLINIYQKGIGFVQNMVQMAVLLLTRNYFLYLGVWLLATLVTNVFISRKADALYPYIRQKPKTPMKREQLRGIAQNTYALLLHRVGAVVVNSTDNLITSAFVGLAEVGKYSNYTLITLNLSAMTTLVFTASTASVGNLGVTADKSALHGVFKKLFFLSFWVYGFCAVALVSLFNPLIRIWAGPDYCFPMSTVILIVVNFYLAGSRVLLRIYRDAFGLFWYFRYKSVVEALVNLVSSLILVQFFGIDGVLMGTVISTLLVAFWVEVYVLYKHVLKMPPWEYFLTYLWYTFVVVVTAALACLVVSLLPEGVWGFLLKVAAVAAVALGSFTLVSFRNQYFRYYRDMILAKLRRK